MPPSHARDHAQQGFLGEVICVFEASQMGTEPPDVRLNQADQLVQRIGIAATCLRPEPIQILHSHILQHGTVQNQRTARPRPAWNFSMPTNNK